jgi:hypothetical protein
MITNLDDVWFNSISIKRVTEVFYTKHLSLLANKMGINKNGNLRKNLFPSQDIQTERNSTK